MDLLERGAAMVGALGEGTPQIVGGVILPSPAWALYPATVSKSGGAPDDVSDLTHAQPFHQFPFTPPRS